MKLKQIEIKNFQSLGDISYSFSNNLTLIDGYNFDLNSHNGSGKSAFLNAISYSIYGKIPKAVNLQELIRDGVAGESLVTQITIEVGSQTIEIQRTRTQTSGKVVLKIDGKKVDGLAKEIESKILELLGFSFEQFVQVVYIFQNAQNRFITLNDTEKKKFLSTLFNLEAFDVAYKKAHEELNQLELDLSKLNGNIEAHTLRLPQLSGQRGALETSIRDFKQKQSGLVVEYTNMCTKINQDIKDLEEKRIASNNQDLVKQLEGQKSQLYLKRMSVGSLKDNIIYTEKALASKQSELDTMKSKIAQYSEDKCPTCGQTWPSWTKGANDKIKQYEASLVRLNEAVVKLQGDLTKYRQDLQDSNETQVEIDYNALIQKIATEKAGGSGKYETEIKLKNQEFRNISLEVAGWETQLKSEQKRLDEINTELKFLQEHIVQLTQSRAQLEDSKGLLLEVKKIFSPVGIKAFIFDGIVKQINERIDGYLKTLMGGLFKFELISDSEKGRFIEKLEYMGSSRSVFALSGGEYRRLSLALDLALSDVISSRMSVVPNVLFLDEPFEGLDTSGREAVMSLLQDLIKTKDSIYVIDHATEMKSMFANTLRLVKQNGITKQEVI